MISLFVDLFATGLTCMGLRCRDPNRKYKYYRVAVYVMALARKFTLGVILILNSASICYYLLTGRLKLLLSFEIGRQFLKMHFKNNLSSGIYNLVPNYLCKYEDDLAGEFYPVFQGLVFVFII